LLFICLETDEGVVVILEACEAVTVAEVGVQLQMTSSEVAELQFPLTTVTSPEASPLATACSHLTALFFLEGELTSALDLLGLR